MNLDPHQKAEYLVTHLQQSRPEPFCRIEDNETDSTLYQNADPQSSDVRWDNGWRASPKHANLFKKQMLKQEWLETFGANQYLPRLALSGLCLQKNTETRASNNISPELLGRSSMDFCKDKKDRPITMMGEPSNILIGGLEV